MVRLLISKKISNSFPYFRSIKNYQLSQYDPYSTITLCEFFSFLPVKSLHYAVAKTSYNQHHQYDKIHHKSMSFFITNAHVGNIAIGNYFD